MPHCILGNLQTHRLSFFQGNTYFSTWAGFILTALLFSKGLRHMFHKDEETAETTTEEKKDEAEVGGGGEEEEVQPEEGA